MEVAPGGRDHGYSPDASEAETGGEDEVSDASEDEAVGGKRKRHTYWLQRRVRRRRELLAQARTAFTMMAEHIHNGATRSDSKAYIKHCRWIGEVHPASDTTPSDSGSGQGSDGDGVQAGQGEMSGGERLETIMEEEGGEVVTVSEGSNSEMG